MSNETTTTALTNDLFNTVIDFYFAEKSKGIETADIMHNVYQKFTDDILTLAKDNYSRMSFRYYTDSFKREVKSIRVCTLSEQSHMQRIAFGLVWQMFKEQHTDRIKLGNYFLLAFRNGGIGFYEYVMDKNFDERFVFSQK